MSNEYKFLGKTSFICFAEHYNEFIKYIKEYISRIKNYKGTIVISKVSIDIKEKIVHVSFSYKCDYGNFLDYCLDIPFDEFDSLTILNK